MWGGGVRTFGRARLNGCPRAFGQIRATPVWLPVVARRVAHTVLDEWIVTPRGY